MAERKPAKAGGTRSVKRSREKIDKTHDQQGPVAVGEIAAERGREMDRGDKRDADSSAEAADQPFAPSANVEAAAADSAARLGAVEADTSPDALAMGRTVAANREDPVGSARAGAEAAQAAQDEGKGNVAGMRALEAVTDVPVLDSPHGVAAEKADPWAGARWAPHGDMNVPAESTDNPARDAQERGLEGDLVKDVAGNREGEDIAAERRQENKDAAKVARESK